MDWNTRITRGTRVTFLDEFRMMVLTPKSVTGVLEFTLFDTLVPHSHPVDSRRFCGPPRYHDRFPTVCVDYDRCFGAPDRGRPLTTDPTQAVIVLALNNGHESCVLLIVRIQTLIGHVRSMGTNACVPWDVWGRDTVVMELPQSDNGSGGEYPSVQGARVIVVKRTVTPGVDGYRSQLRTFDFGRRGWGVLPLRDKGNGPERMALFEDGQDLLVQGGWEMVGWGFDSLGDGRFLHVVSRFLCWECGGTLTPG